MSLILDAEGDLWHHDEDGCKLLGPIDQPRTRGRVPAELAEQLERLDAEWAEMVEFGAAIRAEVNSSYWRGR